ANTATVKIAGGPHVTGVSLFTRRGRVNRVERIVLSFDSPLNPNTTSALGNYILTQRNKTDGRYNVRVRLSDAVYDPAAMTVILFPTRPLLANRLYQLSLSTLGTLA